MEMGTGEIRREYKYTKDRRKCISILTDLNCCSKDDTKEILGLNKINDKKIEEAHKITLNYAEIESLYDRLDKLDAEIKPLEDEYKRTVRMILLVESIKLPAVVQE